LHHRQIIDFAPSLVLYFGDASTVQIASSAITTVSVRRNVRNNRNISFNFRYSDSKESCNQIIHTSFSWMTLISFIMSLLIKALRSQVSLCGPKFFRKKLLRNQLLSLVVS